MEARAEAKFVRMSPRKVRLVVDLIRGMGIQEARQQLQFSQKAAARPVLKVLNSAIANASHNLGADTTGFRVVETYVNDGPTIKRFMPRAHGRATPLRKRMSHITVVVGDGQVVEAPKAKETPAPKTEEKVEKKAAPKKAAPKKEEAKASKEN